MKRTPLFASKLLASDFGANELANPSVTRVDENAVPAASRAENPILPGSGEPCCEQISLPEKPAANPACGAATVNVLLVIETRLPPLNAT